MHWRRSTPTPPLKEASVPRQCDLLIEQELRKVKYRKRNYSRKRSFEKSPYHLKALILLIFVLALRYKAQCNYYVIYVYEHEMF